LVLRFVDAVEPDLPPDMPEPDEGEGHPLPRLT
jgi:hypothetical protein